MLYAMQPQIVEYQPKLHQDRLKELLQKSNNLLIGDKRSLNTKDEKLRCLECKKTKGWIQDLQHNNFVYLDAQGKLIGFIQYTKVHVHILCIPVENHGLLAYLIIDSNASKKVKKGATQQLFEHGIAHLEKDPKLEVIYSEDVYNNSLDKTLKNNGFTKETSLLLSYKKQLHEKTS